jgi:hypothetical protein
VNFCVTGVRSHGDEHHLWSKIANDFDALAEQLERAIQSLADTSPSDVERLRRLRDAARRGAELARNSVDRS